MDYERTVTLHIDRFRNCDTWIGRVATKLREMGGVKMLVMDYARAYFTISTARHPEDIRATLERTFQTNVIIVSENQTSSPPPNLVPTSFNSNLHGSVINQNPNSLSSVSYGAINADLITAVLDTYKPEELVILQSTTFKYPIPNNNVNRRNSSLASTHHDYNSQGSGGIRIRNDDGYVPPPRPSSYTQTAQPYAPPIHMAQGQDYPWLYDYHGVSTNPRDDHDDPACCCTII
uniref:uncharacterized protein LOC122606089 n=1 Tax=Erigeron canadensis TaxID=72917 RepID=UPI001CB8FE0F|nr:uncharacterized protein LOC122606089 [Erigeron canadensis]